MATKVKINTSAVDFQLTSGGNPHRSVARAKSGRIWVAFRDTAGDVNVAYSDDGGTTWTEEQVAALQGDPGNTSHPIMLDSSDIPHLLWFNSTANTIRYSNRSGGTWSAPATVHSGAITNGPWACIDASDDIHLALYQLISGSTLHYYLRTGGAWGSREVVDASGCCADIVVTSGGEPVIFYQNAAQEVALRQRVAGVWGAEEVATSDTANAFGDYWVSAAVDTLGDLHVAWATEAQLVGADLVGQIRYRTRVSSVWQTERTVASTDPLFSGIFYPPTLLLDDADNVYVVYQAGVGQPDENIYYNKIVANVVGAQQTLDADTERPGNHPGVYAGFWQRYNGDSILSATESPLIVSLQEEAGPTYNLYFLGVTSLPPSLDARYFVEVDWNNDGDFSDADEDITADVLTRQGAVVEFERGTEDPDTDRAPVGTASLVVKNADGKYSPENAASALSPNVKPRRRIRIRAIFDGTTYNMWKGYIVRFVPDPDPRRPICTILCEDGMGWLGHPDSRINAPEGAPLSAVKLGAAAGPLAAILDAAGWPAADRTLDEGVDRIDTWWVTDAVPRDAIQELMEMEGSLAFIASDGKFTYKDRHARIKGDGLVSQATFSNTGRGLGYEYGQESIINLAIVTGVVREAATASTYVYGLEDRIQVEPSQTVELWAALDANVSGITAPAANVDYKANLLRDGTGTDHTADVTVLAVQFGQVVRLRVTNNHTRAVWIIPGTSDADETLRIRGTAYSETAVQKQDSDATSITAYQQRSAKVETRYIGRPRRLESHAQFIVLDRKDPRAQYPQLTLLSNSDTLRSEILTLDVGDRITLTVTALGISSSAYHINKVAHRVWNGGVQHEATYWLNAVGVEDFWQIGVSQIGVDNRVAF